MNIKVIDDGKIVVDVNAALTPLQVFRFIKELENALFQSFKKTGKSIDADFVH